MRNLNVCDVLLIENDDKLKNGALFCVDFDTKFIYWASSTGVCVVNPLTEEVHINLGARKLVLY